MHYVLCCNHRQPRKASEGVKKAVNQERENSGSPVNEKISREELKFLLSRYRKGLTTYTKQEEKIHKKFGTRYSKSMSYVL